MQISNWSCGSGTDKYQWFISHKNGGLGNQICRERGNDEGKCLVLGAGVRENSCAWKKNLQNLGLGGEAFWLNLEGKGNKAGVSGA